MSQVLSGGIPGVDNMGSRVTDNKPNQFAGGEDVVHNATVVDGGFQGNGPQTLLNGSGSFFQVQVHGHAAWDAEIGCVVQHEDCLVVYLTHFINLSGPGNPKSKHKQNFRKLSHLTAVVKISQVVNKSCRQE